MYKPNKLIAAILAVATTYGCAKNNIATPETHQLDNKTTARVANYPSGEQYISVAKAGVEQRLMCYREEIGQKTNLAYFDVVDDLSDASKLFASKTGTRPNETEMKTLIAKCEEYRIKLDDKINNDRKKDFEDITSKF